MYGFGIFFVECRHVLDMIYNIIIGIYYIFHSNYTLSQRKENNTDIVYIHILTCIQIPLQKSLGCKSIAELNMQKFYEHLITK